MFQTSKRRVWNPDRVNLRLGPVKVHRRQPSRNSDALTPKRRILHWAWNSRAVAWIAYLRSYLHYLRASQGFPGYQLEHLGLLLGANKSQSISSGRARVASTLSHNASGTSVIWACFQAHDVCGLSPKTLTESSRQGSRQIGPRSKHVFAVLGLFYLQYIPKDPKAKSLQWLHHSELWHLLYRSHALRAKLRSWEAEMLRGSSVKHRGIDAGLCPSFTHGSQGLKG